MGELDVVPGRTHRQGVRTPTDPQLQRLLHREPVGTLAADAVLHADHPHRLGDPAHQRTPIGVSPAGSSRTTIDLDVGVPDSSATESRGTSRLVSGK